MRDRTTKKHNGKQSQGSYFDPTAVYSERGSRDHASYEKSQCTEGAHRESNGSSRPDANCHDGVQGFEVPKPTEDTGPTESQVSNIALQTDTYVNKDMLVAYTIAVVQNTQTLQYEQMQITLQTVQNQASIETLL